MVEVGVIAIDGTKMHANASQHATRDYDRIARQILGEADAVDREEDEHHGDKRGDELAELASREGRDRWLRGAKRDLDERRAVEARPIPHSRQARLKEGKRRLEEELAVECSANAAYEDYRANGRQKNGRRLGAPRKPYTPPATPQGKINLTDLDSRNVKTRGGYMQGYNAQAAVTAGQIVIAAEIFVSSPDFGLLEPVLDATLRELETAGVTDTPEVLVADTGYWHSVQMQQIIDDGIQVLIPPDAGNRQSARPGWDGGRYAFMRRVLGTQLGGDLYRKRKGMIEPVFGNTKFNRGIDRFQRRGRSAVRSEWRLITPRTTCSSSTSTTWPPQRPERTPTGPLGAHRAPRAAIGVPSRAGSTALPRSSRSSPPIQARPRHGRLCATATSRSGTRSGVPDSVRGASRTAVGPAPTMPFAFGIPPRLLPQIELSRKRDRRSASRPYLPHSGTNHLAGAIFKLHSSERPVLHEHHDSFDQQG